MSWTVRDLGVTTQFWCCDRGAELLGWFCVATQSLCRDIGARTGVTEESYGDREFSVAIDFSRIFVTTESARLVSRHSLEAS